MNIKKTIELNIAINTKRRNTSLQVNMKEHNLTLRNKNEVQIFDDMIEDHALFEGMFKSWIAEHILEEDMYDSPIENHLLEDEMPESLIAKHVLEEDGFDSLIAEHVLEEDGFDSLIAEHVLEDDMLESIIREHVLEEDMLESIIREHVMEEKMLDSLIALQLHEESVINDAVEYHEADDCDYDSDYYYDPYENEIGIDLSLNSPVFEYEDSEDSSCCFEIGYYNDGDCSGIFGAYEDMYHPEFVPSFRHIHNF